ERIEITSGETIGSPVIEAAADCWDREHMIAIVRKPSGGRENSSSKRPRTGCTSWDVEEPQPKILPFADRLADFAAYQREERGLSPATIDGQGWQVEKFLSWLGEQNRSFDDVSLEDVDAFLAGNGKRGWGRVSVSTSAKALRAFFRHAAV